MIQVSGRLNAPGHSLLTRGSPRFTPAPWPGREQTASKISEASRVPIKMDDAFIDMDFGPWEGLSLAAVQQRFPQPLDTWRKYPHRFRVQGAETLAQVRKRVRKGLQEATADGPVVVIVTHRVICKLLALHFLGVSNRFFWKVKCDPASITLAEQTGDEITLSMVNQTLHLQDFTGCREYSDF